MEPKASEMVENEDVKLQDNSSSHESQEKEDGEKLLEANLSFSPPLYRQRYIFVRETLEKHSIVRVVDFGCAECKLISHLKTIRSVQEVSGVDVDRDILIYHQNVVKPLTTDYLNKRALPLKVRLFCGSVADYDWRLQDCDAVTLIEIIEHLEFHVLEKLCHTVFGLIKPQLVIISTPNADFNILFPDFSGKRHWDHKFEWSRKEFEEWCTGICYEYGYSVEYTGVGSGPEGTEHLGYCSQVAVFQQMETNLNSAVIGSLSADTGQQQPYELIAECDHPHASKSYEEKISLEISYYIQLLANRELDDVNENGTIKIAIERLQNFKRIQSLCDCSEKFRHILNELGYSLSEDKTYIILNILDDDSDDDCDLEKNDDFESVFRTVSHVNEKEETAVVGDIGLLSNSEVTSGQSLVNVAGREKYQYSVEEGQFSDADQEDKSDISPSTEVKPAVSIGEVSEMWE